MLWHNNVFYLWVDNKGNDNVVDRMTEKRFKETLSTGIVTDTITGKEYSCDYRISDELLELINKIAEENMILKGENAHYKLLLMSLEETARRFCEIPKAKK